MSVSRPALRLLPAVVLAGLLAEETAGKARPVLGSSDRILYARKEREFPLGLLDGEGRRLAPAETVEGVLQIRPGKVGTVLLLDQSGTVRELDRSGRETWSLDLARVKGAERVFFTSVAHLPEGDLLLGGARLGPKRKDPLNPSLERAPVEKGVVARISRAGALQRLREFDFAVRSVRPLAKEAEKEDLLIVPSDALKEALFLNGRVSNLGGGKHLFRAGWEEGIEPLPVGNGWIFFDAEPLTDGGWAAVGRVLSNDACQGEAARWAPDGEKAWSATLQITARSIQALSDEHLLVLGGG